MMIVKPTIAVISLLTGGTLMGFIGSWESRARTLSRQTSSSAYDSPAAKAETGTAESEAAEVMLFEPLLVTASINTLAKPERAPSLAGRPTQIKLLIADKPCSEWRELGPKALMDESGPTARRVRQLCL